MKLNFYFITSIFIYGLKSSKYWDWDDYYFLYVSNPKCFTDVNGKKIIELYQLKSLKVRYLIGYLGELAYKCHKSMDLEWCFNLWNAKYERIFGKFKHFINSMIKFSLTLFRYIWFIIVWHIASYQKWSIVTFIFQPSWLN